MTTTPADLHARAEQAIDIQRHVCELIDAYGLDVVLRACMAKVTEREAAFRAVKEFIGR